MEIIRYLEQAVTDGASDLFVVAGGPVSEKLDGHLKAIGQERLLPPKTKLYNGCHCCLLGKTISLFSITNPPLYYEKPPLHLNLCLF